MSDNKEQYTIELSAKGFKSIEEIKTDLNLPHNEDVLNLALSLIFWATSKSKSGESIGSINKDSVFTRVNIEDLEKLKEKNKNKA